MLLGLGKEVAMRAITYRRRTSTIEAKLATTSLATAARWKNL